MFLYRRLICEPSYDLLVLTSSITHTYTHTHIHTYTHTHIHTYTHTHIHTYTHTHTLLQFKCPVRLKTVFPCSIQFKSIQRSFIDTNMFTFYGQSFLLCMHFSILMIGLTTVKCKIDVKRNWIVRFHDPQRRP